MLNGGTSNTSSLMTTRKGVVYGSNIGGKPVTKGNHGEYCSYCKRSGHTKEMHRKQQRNHTKMVLEHVTFLT